MLTWLPQLLLLQEGNCVYPTTNWVYSCYCRFNDPQSQRGTPVKNQTVPPMVDVLTETVYIGNYHCRIMFHKNANHLHSHCLHWAWNQVQTEACPGYQAIEMIWFWSCRVHASDVELSTFTFGSRRFVLSETHMLTELNAMDSVVLSIFNAYCIMKLLCRRLAHPDFALELPPNKTATSVELGAGHCTFLGVYCKFGGCIFRLWCTRHIVYR